VAIRVRGKGKMNLGSRIEIEVEIFLIYVLRLLQVQEAISYQPISSGDWEGTISMQPMGTTWMI